MNKKISQKKKIKKNSNIIIAKYEGAQSRFMMDCGFPSNVLWYIYVGMQECIFEGID